MRWKLVIRNRNKGREKLERKTKRQFQNRWKISIPLIKNQPSTQRGFRRQVSIKNLKLLQLYAFRPIWRRYDRSEQKTRILIFTALLYKDNSVHLWANSFFSRMLEIGLRTKIIACTVSFLIGWWLVPSKIRVSHEEHRYLPVHEYQHEYKKASGPSIFKGQS